MGSRIYEIAWEWTPSPETHQRAMTEVRSRWSSSANSGTERPEQNYCNTVPPYLDQTSGPEGSHAMALTTTERSRRIDRDVLCLLSSLLSSLKRPRQVAAHLLARPEAKLKWVSLFQKALDLFSHDIFKHLTPKEDVCHRSAIVQLPCSTRLCT